MLLTLSTRTFEGRDLCAAPAANGETTFLNLPDYAIRHLQLRGLNVPASMLAGWPVSDLDRLRDHADKAGCPCLVLIEDQPLPFGSASQAKRDAAAERVGRLAQAAHRLGCNAVSIMCEAADDEESFDLVAASVKAVMPAVERMELNLLLAPTAGLTFDPERLTDLIKRIGGFRIGSLPSFAHAAETGDVVGALRKLAPYAGAVHASIAGFDQSGAHDGYDLAECVEAIRSVGFVNTLAIDFVGSGDPTEAVEQAREVLAAAIEDDGK